MSDLVGVGDDQCPECGGVGDFYDSEASTPEEPVYEECWWCGGTGIAGFAVHDERA